MQTVNDIGLIFLFKDWISSVASVCVWGGGGEGGELPPLFSPAWSVGTFTIFVGTFGFVKNIEKEDLK